VGHAEQWEDAELDGSFASRDFGNYVQTRLPRAAVATASRDVQSLPNRTRDGIRGMGGDGRLSARAAKSDLTRLSGTDSSGSRFAPPQIGNEALHLSGTKT